MRTFVMGDIHGAYKALIQCLEKAEFNYEEDQLVQLGDVADGYNEVFECVEELLKINNLIAIKGNHDEWFNDFIQSGIHPQSWVQGGKATAILYLRLKGREYIITPSGNSYKTFLNPGDIPERHQQFFRNQHLYYIDNENNCFVHGGFNRLVEFKGQIPYMYYWDRSLWTAALSYEAITEINGKFQMVTPFNEIFIGHTSTINWEIDQPIKAANVYNLDTGAGHGSRLTIMEVQTKKYWQSEPVKDLYEKNER